MITCRIKEKLFIKGSIGVLPKSNLTDDDFEGYFIPKLAK
jgi:hypothetical protein